MEKIMKCSFFKELSLRRMLFLALVFGFLINNSEGGCCCGCKSNGKTSKKGKHGGGKPSGEPNEKGGDKKDDEGDDKKNPGGEKNNEEENKDVENHDKEGCNKKNSGGEKNNEEENKKNKERKSNKKITLEFTFGGNGVTKLSIDEVNGKKEIGQPILERGRNGGDIWLFRVDDKDLGKELLKNVIEIEIKDKDKLSVTYLVAFVQMAKKYKGGGGCYILYSSNCQSTDNRGLFDCNGVEEKNAFQCNIIVMKPLACGSNVTDIRHMFSGCSSLEALDLSKFDTSKVTNMSYMFYKCEKLNKIVFGNKFNTGEVTNMSCMFGECKRLNKIIFGNNFDTSKVTNMKSMFEGCCYLEELDLNNFDTSKVTDMKWMFCGCCDLRTIKGGDNFKITAGCNVDNIDKNANESVIDFIEKKKKK